MRALRRQAISSRRSSFLVKAVRSLPHLSNQIAPSWLPKWSHLTQVYNSFSYLPRLDLYIRLKLAQRDEIKHFLRFRFNRQRLFVILEDKNRKRTHMFVTPGLFLRYFEKKKSLKKNRSMKFLMMRFLRKILLVLNLKSVGIITRGVPLHLDSLMTSLFRPLSHPFPDPLTGSVINESDSVNPERGDIHVNSTLFLSSKPFAPQKTRKRGRIKRKIKRRLVRTNSLID